MNDIKEPTLVQCIVKYIIKFKELFLLLIISLVISTGLRIYTLENILETILLGVIASLIVQSFNDYYYIRELRYEYVGKALDKFKELSMSCPCNQQEKINSIEYIHDAFAEISSTYYKYYCRIKINDKKTIDTMIMNYINIMENYTRINKNVGYLYNIDDIYNNILSIYSAESGLYWNYAIKIIEVSFTTKIIGNREKMIIDTMTDNYKDLQYKDFETFIKQRIDIIKNSKKNK